MQTSLSLTLALLTFAKLVFVVDSFAQTTEPQNMVRLVYFVPSGRTPQPDINAKFDKLIKNVQSFFADEMERHGFGRKTFVFETDNAGNAVVHRVNGNFPDSHYHMGAVVEEVSPRFDSTKNVYFTVVDVSHELRSGFCGYGFHNWDRAGNRGGWVFMAAGACFTGEGTLHAAHEVGHAFGLAHDFGNDNYLMSYGGFTEVYEQELSRCAAEWLNVNRYFNNLRQTPPNSGETSIEMLPTTVSQTDGVRFQFKVSDPDGLQIAHLITPEFHESVGGLAGCKNLTGEIQIVEFVTTGLTAQSNGVTLQILDSNDNYAQRQFSVDATDFFTSDAVSIPDRILTSAIRDALELKSKETITQLHMLALRVLRAEFAQITDLTGLEHARNLKYLYVGGNQIGDFTPIMELNNLLRLNISGNLIDDISFVTELTQLWRLGLSGYQIHDLNSFTGLTNLRQLDLSGNQISDISPLANLTDLSELDLTSNQISDISSLAGLTKLLVLGLSYNRISDISPLARLTNLTFLYLSNNNISDISPLAGNTGLGEWERVDLRGNPLSYQSLHTHIPVLQSRGVTVEFEKRTPALPLKISGDNQQGAAGTTLEQPLVVVLRDQDGQAFAGVPVVFIVTGGGGALSITSTTTDTNGRAESTLTLGPRPGTNTVTVSVTGIQEQQTFNAEGIRLAKTLKIVSGDSQQGHPGTALEKAFVVEVKDQANKPLADVEVTFSVTSGGGRLSAQSVTTNSNGRAKSILTLGPDPGRNIVTVSVPGTKEQRTFIAEGIRMPKTLEMISGDEQEGLPGATLENPFVVEVRDQSGEPLPGVQVMFSVTGGDGILRAESGTTNSNGRSESILTLGPNPGTNTVTVSVTGIQEGKTITAEGIRIPKSLEIVSGDDQEGLPGAALTHPFVVEILDDENRPVPGVQVTFSVSSGGGTLSAGSVTADANGRAESTLTLGPDPGTNAVTVSVTGIQEQQTFNAEGIRIPLAFWIISGDKQQGVTGEALTHPFVVEVRDRSGERLPSAQVTFAVTGGGGTLSLTSAKTDDKGRAESTLTLGANPGTNSVTIAVTGIRETQTVTAIAELPPIPEDINGDDVVNILDLVSVASNLGDEGTDLAADVNGDGVVNILDLVMVAGALGNAAAAPTVRYRDLEIAPTAASINEWLIEARALGGLDEVMKRGILRLENLLAALTPSDTALLPNYPNPFNPETWIPYHLAHDAEVRVAIYDINGALMRILDIGYQQAGFYMDKGSAAYWDGRDRDGEPVASGIYFYSLSAGDFAVTRRMLILK